MEAVNVSAGAALEAINPSGTRWMKASTAVDDVEQLYLPALPRTPRLA